MSEANKSFTKVIIISVIMVLIIAGLLYLLPMAFKNESSSPIINVNPIDKRMDKIEDFEFEFSDETGCGCELTEERIVEEEKMRIEENGMIEDIIEE